MVAPTRPETDPAAESVLFVVDGALTLTLDGTDHETRPPAATPTCLRRRTGSCATTLARQATFHWIRKAYQRLDGLDVPEAFVTNQNDVEARPMPDTNGVWTTTRFVEPEDLRHDMHINIVTFQPGGAITFPETHVMEHGLYVLEGKAVYLLNEDWVEVEAGDFMWLRAFCPQACYAGGPEQFSYLLYKDVNRHMPFIKAPRPKRQRHVDAQRPGRLLVAHVRSRGSLTESSSSLALAPAWARCDQDSSSARTLACLSTQMTTRSPGLARAIACRVASISSCTISTCLQRAPSADALAHALRHQFGGLAAVAATQCGVLTYDDHVEVVGRNALQARPCPRRADRRRSR